MISAIKSSCHIIRCPLLGLAVLLSKVLLDHGTANRVIEVSVLLKSLNGKGTINFEEITIPAP